SLPEETADSPPSQESPRIGESVAGLLVLIARVSLSPVPPWRDWVVIGSLCWIAFSIARTRAVRGTALAAGGAYLLGLYILGQWHAVLSIWMSSP
ncbi:MAG TPA: hypothetical protein VKU80_04030, partial [Planctomycetota bacterium]|nr:hypothetical protein [Planctomycetota bacterium]